MLGDKLQSAATQVCLAAEKCGNLDFDVRNDMWNSSEGLFCNTSVHRTITFWDILTKVSRPQHNHSIMYRSYAQSQQHHSAHLLSQSWLLATMYRLQPPHLAACFNHQPHCLYTSQPPPL
jgi:hypothetical protein